MFKCALCHNVIGPKTKATKLVTKTRPATYYNNVKGKEVITEGWEIVKEILICPECAEM